MLMKILSYLYCFHVILHNALSLICNKIPKNTCKSFNKDGSTCQTCHVIACRKINHVIENGYAFILVNVKVVYAYITCY